MRAFAIARRTLQAASAGGEGKGPRRKGARRAPQLKAALDDALDGRVGPDSAFATELVYGVVRRRRTLRAAIGSLARRAFKGRAADVEIALELGAYALVWARADQGDVSPASAAIDAAVALAGGGKKQKKRVRGALERLAGTLEGFVAQDALPPGAAEDGRALPVSRGRAALFRKPVLDLAGASPARRLALVHSYPDDLVHAWVERFGAADAERICVAGNDPPPLFARANALRTTPGALAERLAAEGVRARVVAGPAPGLPHALLLEEGRGRFRATAAFREGLFAIQDATAQEAPLLLSPRPGERVLDLCAAPGGKTAYLAELALDRAAVLATDRSDRRLRRVAETARRLGLASIATRPLDARAADALATERFDAVLVDAPCSNTGVLRRRPEARWRYSGRSQRRLVEAQARILATGLRALAPGGRLVYSVCSIEREEGAALVARAILERPDLTLVEERLRLPAPGAGDGGYLALVRAGGGPAAK